MAGKRSVAPTQAEDEAWAQAIVDRDQKISDYRSSFRAFALDCLKINTKKHGLQPLDLNSTQLKVTTHIANAKKKGHAARFVVLKARQQGISTLAEAILFWRAALWPHRSSLVITHKDKATKNLFRMVRRYYRHLPGEIRPGTTFENVNEIEFDNDSRIQVETAGDARSYTAQDVHISELGFIERAEETLTAVLQTVPDSTDSLVILESTANGAGNTFHKVWTDACEPTKRRLAIEHGIGFVPIFIPWFVHEEYSRPAWFPNKDLDQDERLLMQRFELTLEQMAWRRWCIQTDCLGDEEKFQVEYPSTPEEAFLLSGRPVFQPAVAVSFYIGKAMARDQLPPLQEIEWVTDQQIPEARMTETAGGRLRIFQKPEPRHTYKMGADPSEGDRGSDPTPIEIIDQMTLTQVAEWYGKAPPDLLAHYSFAMGMYYNAAEAAGEANNHGGLYHASLIQMGYPNIYFRTTSIDDVSQRVTKKPGWLQTTKNKHFIYDTGRRFIREGYKRQMERERLEKEGGTPIGPPTFVIHSPILMKQVLAAAYVRKDEDLEAKIVANDPMDPEVAHLDALTAFLIALSVHRGTIESPLEPLPEDALVEAATHAMLLRERDPEAANAYTVDFIGMTCDQLFKALEDKYALRTGRGGGVAEGMT